MSEKFTRNMNVFSLKNMTAIFIAGFVVLLILILFGDFEKTFERAKSISIETFFLLISFTLLNDAFRFLKWEYFLRTLNLRVKPKISLAVFASGIIMSLTPAKVGELMKSQLLKEKAGIPRRNTIMVIFSERLTDAIGLALLSLLGLTVFFANAWSLLIIFLIIGLALYALSNESMFMRLLSVLNHIPIIKKYTYYAHDSYKNSKKLFTPAVLTVSTLISIISWFFECLELYIILQALGAPIPLSSAVFIFSFSSIVGSLFLLPGGIGAAEGSFVGLLLIAGVGNTIASLATIIIRLTTLWIAIPVGIISFFYVSKMKSFESADSESF